MLSAKGQPFYSGLNVFTTDHDVSLVSYHLPYLKSATKKTCDAHDAIDKRMLLFIYW